MKVNKPIHLVIREGKYNEESLKGDSVTEHNNIADQKQTVLYGKLGRLPEAGKLALLQKSIEETGISKLIVVRKTRNGYEGFGATIRNLHTGKFSPDISQVPAYYHHLIPEIKLWLQIQKFTKLQSGELRQLGLLSNERPLLETLSICRTSLMLVKNQREH